DLLAPGGAARRTRRPGRLRTGEGPAGARRDRRAGAETRDGIAPAHAQGGRADAARRLGRSDARVAFAFMAHRAALERYLRPAADPDDRLLGGRGKPRRHDRPITLLHQYRTDRANRARSDRTTRALFAPCEAQAPGADPEGVAMMAQLAAAWRERPWRR